MKLITKKEFYANVKFKDEASEKYLRKAIFSFATKNNLDKFEYITNYVSHATHGSSTQKFNVSYPVTISGTNISNFEIVDAKGDVFHICLLFPSTIIYYEKLNECIVNVFIAKREFKEKEGEKRFSSKRIRYIIQDLE